MAAGQPAKPLTPILMPTCVLSPQNVLAKALYDNVAESPDELSFRKGDIMTVLERDTQGLDGWWLCSLHGRQGIVPGNRLKILVGMHDKKPAGPGPGPPTTSAQPQPGLHAPAAQYTPMLPATYQPQPDSVYLVPTPSKTQQGLYQAPGPSPQFQSPPAKQTSTFSKQMPHHPFSSPAPDLYQVPPGPGSPAQDIYQVPPAAGIGHDIYQVPPSMDARSWEGTKTPAKVRLPWHDRAIHPMGVFPRRWFLDPAGHPWGLQGSSSSHMFVLGQAGGVWGGVIQLLKMDRQPTEQISRLALDPEVAFSRQTPVGGCPQQRMQSLSKAWKSGGGGQAGLGN